MPGSSAVDFSIVLHYLPFLLQGAWITIQISFFALILGSILGFILCMASLSEVAAFRWVAHVLVWILRGTPLLLQILLIYYWLPTIGLRFPPYEAGIITLSIGTSAYYAEIFRAAISAVPLGQTEAAYAVGMSRLQVMRRIVLPLAIRPALPPYVGMSITMVKNTSLVSVISVQELMFQADSIYSSTYRVAEILGTAGVLYLLIISVLQLVQLLLEKRLSYYAVR
jgi:His/Glu/Gln/Arg/opine family amino acid ABC transporter permease subunit